MPIGVFATRKPLHQLVARPDGYIAGRTDADGTYDDVSVTPASAALIAELVQERRPLRARGMRRVRHGEIGHAVRAMQRARKSVDLQLGRTTCRSIRTISPVGGPNGSYEIIAKVVVSNDSADNQISVACALSTSPSADDTSIDYRSVTVAPQSRLPLTLLATHRYGLAVGTPVVWVACRSSGPGSARWTKIVATPVSKIN